MSIIDEQADQVEWIVAAISELDNEQLQKPRTRNSRPQALAE
jgi:hypothetical protein